VTNYRIIVMAPLFAKLHEKMLENRGRKLQATPKGGAGS
jgi:hypothetical protein